MNILEVKNLSVEYYRHRQVIRAVDDVSFYIKEGETLALVGESGSGKSTAAMAILGLIFANEGKITCGEIIYKGANLLNFSKSEWQSIRGKEIAIIFQDPFSSLNPVMSIGEQIMETIAAHREDLKQNEQLKLAHFALEEVKLTPPQRFMHSYPHQLSGGQRQRVVIAMAIIHRPKILIADEPTTALDVTIQKEILDLIDMLKKELSLTVLLITHNLPIARNRSERVTVMRNGKIVETNATNELITNPQHPYTKELISSVPKL